MRRLEKIMLTLGVVFALGSVAAADDVTVTLDLTFDSGRGSAGSWQLFAQVVDTGFGAEGQFGLSAVRALLDGIDFGMGGDAVTLASGIGAIDPIIDSQGNILRPPVLQQSDGTIDLIYGQDLSESETFPGSGVFNAVVPFVGVGSDVLIASGTFSAGANPGFGQDNSGPTTLLTDALFLNTSSGPFGPSVRANSVQTFVVDNLPEGDFNGDAIVNAADYTVWRDSIGQSDEILLGNGTNDPSGNVVLADNDLWRSNFGRTSSAAVSTIAVPEPAAWLLLSAGLIGGLGRRAR